MFTGNRAFHGETKVATLSAVLRNEPPSITTLIEGVPPELDRIIARCLRKDPARRFQHLEDLKVALQEIREESDSGKLSATPRYPAAACGELGDENRRRHGVDGVSGGDWVVVEALSGARAQSRSHPAHIGLGSELHASAVA